MDHLVTILIRVPKLSLEKAIELKTEIDKVLSKFEGATSDLTARKPPEPTPR